MDWFQVSFHSVGVFVVFLILVTQSTFLLLKKDKTTPTYWLMGVFIGFTVMLFGYTLAYSVYHPIGAYHRYLTVFVLFGNASFSGFAYNFPKNIHPKESKIAMWLAFLLAIGGYIHFVVNTWNMEKFYNFEAHFYSFDFGAQTAIIILSLFLWPLIVLIRKTIAFSAYDGKFKPYLEKIQTGTSKKGIKYYFVKFIVGWNKFLFPVGRDAQYIKTFALVILLLIVTAVTNVLNKSGIMSYEYYAIYYSNSTLIICFVMLMAYLNSSGEPTTFMAKLVGISLVTVMLVFGFVSNITLNVAETDYDNQRISEIKANKEYILNGNYDHLPENMAYIIRKPKNTDIFDRELELLFTRKPEAINTESLKKGELEYRELLIKELMQKLAKKNKSLDPDALHKLTIEEYRKSRQYQNLQRDMNTDGKRMYRSAGKLFTNFDLVSEDYRYEIGFYYTVYRQHTHKIAIKLFGIAFLVAFLILLLFPLFFRSSLVKPLNNLLMGVSKVNQGDLEVKVPIKVQDEIGYLSNSFNAMVSSIKDARQELQHYANTLEEKVQERTKEVQEKMQEVQTLKVQQDGDYFLTSLLTKPLFINANKSENIKTEFLIRQKKKFEFRNRHAELGGDICITGNLKLGTPQKYRRYTMGMNGDAMGKSMQGAGGSLVMGVVVNSIMARSASNKKILNTTPEQWLTDAYHECNSVFKSFNGTMVLSATVLLIDDITGDVWYWNAEHPFTILYRDEKATFVEEDLQLRKLGLDSEYAFKVRNFKLQPGDVIILGSDGRDDIDLTPDEPFRTINDDENMILSIVEEAGASLEDIEGILKSKGNITDDLSFLKMTFTPTFSDDTMREEEIQEAEIVQESIHEITNKSPNLPSSSTNFQTESMAAYEKGKILYQENRLGESLNVLYTAFKKDNSNLKLNKLLGLIAFKFKDYKIASEVLGDYLKSEETSEELWYYYSIALKRIGELISALQAALKIHEINQDHLNNIINIADLYRLIGEYDNARIFAEKALNIDSENKNAKKILAILSV